VRGQAADRGFDVARHQRRRHDFTHASSHRFEQELRIELIGDNQDAGRGVLSLLHCQGGRQLSLRAQIQDDQVRLPCARLRERRELAARDRRGVHPTRSEDVFELTIGRTYEQYV
jgi:hypothetical protein